MYLFHKSFNTLSKLNNYCDAEIIHLVYEMCKEAGVKNIKISILDEDDINGAAYSELLGEKRLYLTRGTLNLPWEEIAAIAGHEIIHLKKNDGTKLDWVKRCIWYLTSLFTLLLMLVLIYFFIKIPYIGTVYSVVMTPVIIIYFLSLLFLSLIDGRRFWSQIQELRADRLACELNGVTRIGMISLLRRLQSEYNTTFDDLPWYNRYYYRYFELFEHPCLSRRIRLLEKYRSWSVIDYFLHTVVMSKWFITGRGWNGN